MNWNVSPTEFESMIAEALDDLPEEFRRALENIVVVAEEEPSRHDLELIDGDADDPDELLGVFRGVPMTARSYSDPVFEPNSIAIFRGPILRCCDSKEEAIEEIRETVIHELGHYFGLEDDEMPF